MKGRRDQPGREFSKDIEGEGQRIGKTWQVQGRLEAGEFLRSGGQ